ncbi:hypothetical protein BM526_20430 (plasmid) [Alteromonas mediterranea]|uniref:hypothetical protein n=1 Tax=Alteromonas mediterranea TaxID=314275 RepID=UPI0009031D3E|nr:hypothetical protein [Alteromonas mediterranea]APE04341.1 hypothetical protein BM526_20430 [Alteromonas mediterranea]
MISRIKALFASSKDDSESFVYLGADEAPRVPDENEKTYTFFHLVSEGKHKGKYKAGLAVGRGGEISDKMREREAIDIHNSGYEIVSLGNYETDEVMAVSENTESLVVKCFNCQHPNIVKADEFEPNVDGHFLDDAHYGLHCSKCGGQIIIQTKITA